MKYRKIVLLTMGILLFVAGCDNPTITFRSLGSDGDVNGGAENPADDDPFLDGDTSSDGDSPLDGDTPSDGDFVPDGDTETLAEGIHARFLNAGDQAAYFSEQYDWGELVPRSVTVLDVDRVPLQTKIGCAIFCDDPCMPIDCEAPTPTVRQVLPGEHLDFHWDGEYFSESTCESTDGSTVACLNRKHAADGQYYLKVCHSAMLALPNSGSNPHRSPEDLIENTDPEASHCEEYPIELEPGVHVLEESIVPFLEEEGKPWGYCGQSWTFTPYAIFEILDGNLDITEGSSLVVPVWIPGNEIQAACRWNASMEVLPTFEEDHLLSGGLFIGSASCEMSMEDRVYGFVLPPPPVGTWAVETNSLVGMTGDYSEVQVSPCPECLACESDPVETGASCLADCDCKDAEAVCHWNCQRYCLTSLDCPENTICRYRDEMAAVMPPVCMPLEENACGNWRECPPGHRCGKETQTNEWQRCLPLLDTRIIADNHGMGIHCGCDAECPGAQRCIRFEENFTKGFCALTCRDKRECPENWSCLGMTQSGLQGICMPPGR